MLEVVLWWDGEGLELQQVVKDSGILEERVVLQRDGSFRTRGRLGAVQVLHLQKAGAEAGGLGLPSSSRFSAEAEFLP